VSSCLDQRGSPELASPGAVPQPLGGVSGEGLVAGAKFDRESRLPGKSVSDETGLRSG